MALDLLTTTAFERDLRRIQRQAKDVDKLEAIVNLLQAEEQLPYRCHPHPLRGNWAGYWDCHVEPDWLLIYKLTETQLTLVRTGSHSDVFR